LFAVALPWSGFWRVMKNAMGIKSWLGLFEQHPRLSKWRVCRV
jgi:hypothetical protein